MQLLNDQIKSKNNYSLNWMFGVIAIEQLAFDRRLYEENTIFDPRTYLHLLLWRLPE